MAKAEIMTLVEAEEGRLKVNEFCELHRWTKSALNEDVDRLELVFKQLNHVEFSGRYEVKSRDFKGIIEEMQAYTGDFFNKVSMEIQTQIKSGYICK